MRNWMLAAANAGLPVVVTEWGTVDPWGQNSADTASSDEWIAAMRDNQISWCNWDLFDKQPPETASMFKAGTSPVGPWSDADLTDTSYFGDSKATGVPMYYSGSGQYVKGVLPSPFTQFVVSPSLLTFNYRTGTQITKLTNNAGTTWTATAVSDGNWLSVTPESTSDTPTYTDLTIGVDPHGGTADRTGTVELTDSAGRKAKVLVVQQYNDGNLARGQTTTASSEESPSYHPQYATDGDGTNTRWSSLPSNDQWICVDLGDSYYITGVTLQWEAAYSTHYHVALSNTSCRPASEGNTDWNDIYVSDNLPTTLGEHSDPLDATMLNTAISGRFIRMWSETRAISTNDAGVSLWELKVFGHQ
jgi:hypothetical protein